jgi:hypothetical protein
VAAGTVSWSNGKMNRVSGESFARFPAGSAEFSAGFAGDGRT